MLVFKIMVFHILPWILVAITAIVFSKSKQKRAYAVLKKHDIDTKVFKNADKYQIKDIWGKIIREKEWNTKTFNEVQNEYAAACEHDKKRASLLNLILLFIIVLVLIIQVNVIPREFDSINAVSSSRNTSVSSSKSTSGKTRKCPICGRSFNEGSSDYKNIGWANMCNNCETNYHYVNGD